MKAFTEHEQWQEYVDSMEWGDLETDWLRQLDPHYVKRFDDVVVLVRASEESHKYSIGFLYFDGRPVIGTLVNPSANEDDKVLDRIVQIEDDGTIWFRTGQWKLILRREDDEWIVQHARSRLNHNYIRELDVMFERNTWQCAGCNSHLHNDDTYYDVCGEWYCESCENEMVVCTYCGYERPQPNSEYHNADCCPDCEDNLIHCYNCGDLTDTSDTYLVQHGDEVCETCYHDRYTECRGCGEAFRSDYGNSRCDECGDIIQSYGHTGARYFYTLDGRTDTALSTMRFYGTELEIEVNDHDDRYEVAEDVLNHYDTRVIDLKNDGSLDHGFEIVHQPATLEYYQKHYPKILERLRANRCTSHDTSTCGLHIHISRHNLTPHTEIKMAYFIMEYQNFMKKFSRRRYTGYCERTPKSLDSSARNSNGRDAFAFHNRDTIEFRMPKGTLNEETYLATIEFLDALAKFCEITDIQEFHNEEEIMQRFIRMAEYAIRKYPNLYKYLDRRNIPEMYNYRPKRKLERTVYDEGDYAVVKDHSEQESA